MTVASEGGQVTDALSGKLTFEQSKNRIIGRDENNLARLLILADGDQFVMKISADAIDVLSGSDDDMIFNSNNNLFKIVERGETTLTMPALADGTSANVSDTIPHSLGYSPLVVAFISIDSPLVPGLTLTRPFGGSKANAKSVSTAGVVIAYLSDESVEASATDVIFRWTVSNAIGAPQPPVIGLIKYYLLTETAD